jgi:signal transduction histidine kinase
MDQSIPGGLTSQSRDAIREAALTITSELSLPILLNRIVGLAREMSGARYAALGIPDPTSSHLVQFITSGMDEEAIGRMDELPVGKGLLGELLKPDARPIRTPNIVEHPASAGFCPHHPRMTSFLGVPIRSRGKLLGNLYMTDKIGADEFTEYDQILIETLAAYAAVAIENARLHQRMQRLVILEERERFGMDLHDGVIQSIYAVGLMLDHARYLLKEGDIESVDGRIEEAIDGLNTTIKDIRNYILDLRPSKLQGKDLRSALRVLMHEFQVNTLAEVDLNYSSEINGKLSEQTSTTAFLIIQEALANAAKHAAATHLQINIDTEDDLLVLDVEDNGMGFEMAATEQRLGHGLVNMKMRAHAVGGRLEVDSKQGRGTHVVAYLPIKENSKKEDSE